MNKFDEFEYFTASFYGESLDTFNKRVHERLSSYWVIIFEKINFDSNIGGSILVIGIITYKRKKIEIAGLD